MTLTSKLKNIHFLSFMGTGGMSVLLFIFNGILYRSLSIRDIGIWFFFQTLLSFLDTFRQGFLTTAFIKFYTGAKVDRKNEVIGSTWVISLGITLFFILINIPIFFLLSYITDASLNYALKWFSINLLSSLPMVIGMCVAQGDLKFDRLLYIRLTQVLLMIALLGVLILTNKNNLHNLMLVNIVASGLTSLFTIIMGWAGIKFFWFKSKSCVIEIFNFGKYTVGTSISSNLFGVTDTFIINFMLGPSSLAVYNLGKRLMEVVEIPIRSFVATAMPSLSKAYNAGDKLYLIEIMKKYIGMITIALIPVLIVAYIFAGYAMSIIGGGQYSGTEAGRVAVNIFKLSVTFALLYPADRFMSVTLDVIHKPHINFMKVIIMLVINLFADVIGIYILGNIYGVIIGTILPLLTAILISNYYIQNSYQKFSFSDIYKSGFREISMLITNPLKNYKNKRISDERN